MVMFVLVCMLLQPTGTQNILFRFYFALNFVIESTICILKYFRAPYCELKAILCNAVTGCFSVRFLPHLRATEIRLSSFPLSTVV